MSVVDRNHLCIRLFELAHDMTSEKSSRAGYRNPLRANVGQQFKFSVFPRHTVITFPPKNKSVLQPLRKCTGSRVTGGKLVPVPPNRTVFSPNGKAEFRKPRGLRFSSSGLLYCVARDEIVAFDFTNGKCLGSVAQLQRLNGQALVSFPD
jgi:hypothetical protein